MTPERWRQVKGILEDILELDTTLRAAHLDAACEGDEALRRDVESFLDAPGELDGFLQEPAVGRPPAVPDSVPSATGSGTTGPVAHVRPPDLAPYSTLRVATRTSVYQIIVVSPLDRELLVQGGKRFPEATRARLYRQDTISVGKEITLEVGSRQVTTTKVTSIEITD